MIRTNRPQSVEWTLCEHVGRQLIAQNVRGFDMPLLTRIARMAWTVRPTKVHGAGYPFVAAPILKFSSLPLIFACVDVRTDAACRLEC